MLFADTDKTVQLWDVASGQSLTAFDASSKCVSAVAASGNWCGAASVQLLRAPCPGNMHTSHRLFAASESGVVSVWDASSNTPRAVHRTKEPVLG